MDELLDIDWDDPYGPFGPLIRRIMPEPEPFYEEDDRDGGDYDQDEYLPELADSKTATGTGTPEANLTAGVGSICQRRNGGALTSFYVKETGTGNTGWVGK